VVVDGDGDGDDSWRRGDGDDSSTQLRQHRDDPRNKLDPTRVALVIENRQDPKAVHDRRAFHRRSASDCVVPRSIGVGVVPGRLGDIQRD
jgi:hypothetical protein